MKFLKTLGFILLAFIAIALIAGAFLPTHFEHERSTDIDASKELIYNKINDMTTWKEWDPWGQTDPTMKVTYGDKTEGVGASTSWTSENSGNGTQTIIEAEAPVFQKTKLEFDGEGGGEGWFKLEDGDNGATLVKWGFSYDMPYPFNVMSLLPFGPSETEMNEMFDLGLANLKKICEKEASMVVRGFMINLEDFPGVTYLAIRDRMAISEETMQPFFEKSYGAIMGAMGAKGLQIAGYPTGIYYEWDEETNMTDMAAAIPVPDGTEPLSKDMQVTNIPAGKCLLIDHRGSYDGLGEAHYAMDDYMKANNLTFKPPVLEVYVTDPAAEPNPSKWLTKIYYFYEGPVAEK